MGFNSGFKGLKDFRSIAVRCTLLAGAAGPPELARLTCATARESRFTVSVRILLLVLSFLRQEQKCMSAAVGAVCTCGWDVL